MSVVAVICARGGSKGIPRKNIRAFAGHPLIAWTIRAALAANGIDHVVLSSDDDDILAVAEPTAHILAPCYSLENWGGATFDVCLRFLRECVDCNNVVITQQSRGNHEAIT